MAREVKNVYGGKAIVLTTADNSRIGSGRLSLRVRGDGGSSGQLPFSQDEALELAIALVETVRELRENEEGAR